MQEARQHLSHNYGLSLIRLAAAGRQSWPGLLLHSRTHSWVFDRHGRQLTACAVDSLSLEAGLHPITEPFTTDPPAGPWTFRLPTLRRHAQLSGPGVVVDVTRTPRITDDWWCLAVANGGRCRILVAAGIDVPDEPAAAAGTLTAAAADRRVFGATIGVDF